MIRKKIKDIEVNMLMSLKESDITLDFLKKLFVMKIQKEKKFLCFKASQILFHFMREQN